jgi:hypothetical protein
LEEKFAEIILKYGSSIALNIWFMFRIEKLLMKNHETNERVLARLDAERKAED